MSLKLGNFSIYKITNLINNKVYIGQTKGTIHHRFMEHCRLNNPCSKLRRAMDKYGRDNFIIEQIDHAHSKEELDEKEIFWIKEYNSVKDGYNIGIGGKCTGKQQPIFCITTNEKFDSILECANKYNLNPSSISDVCSGRKASHKGFRFAYVNNNFVDYDKIKEPRKFKKVMCLETGTIYNNCLDASRILGLSRNSVSNVAYGRNPTTNNLHFAFVDDKGKPLINKEVFKKRKRQTKIICIETGVIYNSPKEASLLTGIYKESIFQSIRKGCRAGGYHWSYYKKGEIICL